MHNRTLELLLLFVCHVKKMRDAGDKKTLCCIHTFAGRKTVLFFFFAISQQCCEWYILIFFFGVLLLGTAAWAHSEVLGPWTIPAAVRRLLLNIWMRFIVISSFLPCWKQIKKRCSICFDCHKGDKPFCKEISCHLKQTCQNICHSLWVIL